jgi:hypothetical protein
MAGLSLFISYRRATNSADAGRLYDALRRRFPRANLFIDVDSLRPGQDWSDAIESAINRSDAVLVLIGRGWADVRDDSGKRRLANAQDPVRREIETAFRQGKPVIPVLFDEARVPSRRELPTSLAELAGRHAVHVSHATFESDLAPLYETLDETANPPSERSPFRRWPVAIGAGALGLLLLGGAIWAVTRPEPTGTAAPSGTGAAAARVAWIEGEGETSELYTLDIDAAGLPLGSPRRWPFQGTSPAWDPSGRFLILGGTDLGNQDLRGALVVVDTERLPGLEQHATVRISGVTVVDDPSISPDGTRIVVSAEEGDEECCTIRIASLPDLHQLVNAGSEIELETCALAETDEIRDRYEPSWSKDGKVAFVETIYTLVLAEGACGSDPQVVSTQEALQWVSLAWGTDDAALIGGAFRPPSDEQIYRIALDGTITAGAQAELGSYRDVSTSGRFSTWLYINEAQGALIVSDDELSPREPIYAPSRNVVISAPAIVDLPT